jgi:hypothetical protein
MNRFRIGTLGHVFPDDIGRLIAAVEVSCYWQFVRRNRFIVG